MVLGSAVLVAGCGDGGDSGTPAGKTTAAAKSSGGPAPAELVGTYTVRLRPGDLPSGADAPPEFAPENHPYAWRVEIANSGGPDDGPTLNIVNVASGSLESPRLSVDGDRLRLSDEECAGSTYTFVDTVYGWKLAGKALSLSKVSGGCGDKVAETILTARPLTKTT